MKCIKRDRNLIAIIIAVVLAITVFIGVSGVKATFAIDNGANIELLASYSTSFRGSISARKKNIQLAARKLDGYTVLPNAKFSFNEVVGERTVQNGFDYANIIVKGKYVKGIGGGVCQVSTTLYNAWMLSGLDVEVVRCHSLPISYAPLSRDASVSQYQDMVLVNTSPFEVCITAFVDKDSVQIKIYGINDGFEYKLTQELIEVLESDKIEVIESAKEGIKEEMFEVVSRGCKGYVSKGYSEQYKNGKLINKKFIRQDYYVPVPPQVIRYVPIVDGDTESKL